MVPGTHTRRTLGAEPESALYFSFGLSGSLAQVIDERGLKQTRGSCQRSVVRRLG